MTNWETNEREVRIMREASLSDNCALQMIKITGYVRQEMLVKGVSMTTIWNSLSRQYR